MPNFKHAMFDCTRELQSSVASWFIPLHVPEYLEKCNVSVVKKYGIKC